MTRLNQLSHKDLIRLTCNQCGHIREIPSRFLAAIVGEEMTLSSIQRRLRCKACGSNKASKLEVLYNQVDQQADYLAYREPDNLRKPL
jgi:RNase P subunit RPR2